MNAALIPFILIFILTVPLQATIYFVRIDQPAADDRGPGSVEQPWKTCPGMPGWEGDTRLQAGDIVRFHNQGVWPITHGDSGLQVTAGVLYDGESWGPGGLAVLRAECDLSRTLVNFLEDDPVTPTEVRGFELDVNGHVTTGAAMNWPQMQRDLTGAVKRIRNCRLHGVYARQSLDQYEYGIVISSWHGFHVSNVEIINCEVFDIARAGIAAYPGNDIPDNKVENVLIRGCTIYRTGTDPESSSGSALGLKNHVVNAVLEDNTTFDTMLAGIIITTHPEPGFQGPQNITIRHNILRATDHCGIFIQHGGDKSIDITGNLIFNNRYEAIKLAATVSGRLDLRIVNNTFFNNNVHDWSQEIAIEDIAADVERLELMNNVFYASARTRCLLDIAENLTDHAFNLYHRAAGYCLVRAGDNDYTTSNIHTWEPTALIGDPRFKDSVDLPAGFAAVLDGSFVPDGDGLSLTWDSPGRDAGVRLAAPFAEGINRVLRPAGLGWDLGAYEIPVECGTYLDLNKHFFVPGDTLRLVKYLSNSTAIPIPVHDYVYLELDGAFWFWPSWQPSPDSLFRILPPDNLATEEILRFTWPQDAPASRGTFYTTLIDARTGTFLGRLTGYPFTYNPNPVPVDGIFSLCHDP